MAQLKCLEFVLPRNTSLKGNGYILLVLALVLVFMLMLETVCGLAASIWTTDTDKGIPAPANSDTCVSGCLRCGLLCRNGCPHLSQVRAWYTPGP